MRVLLSVFRNCSSAVLCFRECSPSVVRHTPSSTWTLRSNILHRSRGSSQGGAHSGYTDDRFPACHIEDKIL
jgi:hypothetical protein